MIEKEHVHMDDDKQEAPEVVGATGIETGGGPIDVEMDSDNDGEVREMEFVGEGIADGLTGLFNTFRLGEKWKDLKELEELQLVTMNNTEEGAERTPLAWEATVLSIHVGELGDMLRLHAGLNHGCKQAMPADRYIELRRALHDVYGRMADHDTCVVVYMHRMLTDYDGDDDGGEE